MLEKRRWTVNQNPGRVLLSILLLAFMLPAFQANATHFRGGTLTWQQAGGTDIQFTLNTSWRRGFFGAPVVNSTVSLGNITYGDGNSDAIVATVNSFDAAADIINTTFIVTHHYSTTGNFVVQALNSGNRLSTITGNNHDAPYNLQTIVNVGSPLNNSPVSSQPAIVNVPFNTTSVFTIPGSDPDGDNITFRMALTGVPTSTTDQTHESGLNDQTPPGFTLASNGTVTMVTTSGVSVGDLFAVQVMMEDHNAATNAVKTKSPVDFLIRIVPFSAPPVFVSPTPLSPNNVFSTLPGNNVSFTVAANDPDLGQSVTLNPVPVPLGSTMSPALPTTGAVNGTVSSAFSWTPTTSQVGTFVINFVAADNLGVQAFTSVTINVLCALDATTSITPATCAGQSNGAVTVTPSNFSSAANLTYTWTGPNSFSSSSQNISGLAAGTYNLRIDDIATGCFKNLSAVVPNSLTVTPGITSNSPVCAGGTLSLSASGGNSYSWTGPNGFNSLQPAPSISNVTSANAGVYTLTATQTATGCAASTTALVSILPAPTVSVSPNGPTTFCQGGSVTLNSSSAVSYLWNNPGASTTQSIVVNTSGSYAVTVTGTNGCTATSAPTIVNVTPLPVVAITASPTGSQCPGTPVTLTSSPANSYLWSNSATTQSITVIAYGTNAYSVTSTVNSCSSSQSITVIGADNTNPTISATPNINVNNDPGVCGAVVNYNIPTVSDNCMGCNVTSIPGYTLVGTLNGHRYFKSTSPGLWGPFNTFAQSLGGHLATITTAAEQAFLQANTSGASWIGINDVATEGTFVWSNGEAVSYTNWCSGEPNNNGGVEDFGLFNFGSGGCWNDGDNATLFNAIIEFDCGIFRSAGLASGSTFPVGTSTVTYTASDASRNTVTQSFTVTVTDNERPVITCPANVTQCNDQMGNFRTLVLAASDNCGITSTSYVVSGATTAMGSGNTVAMNFNLGTSMVVWTVKDAANNTSVCTTTVLVRALPVATITSSDADAFCNELTLTGHSSFAGTNSYAWTFGSSAFASTQAIKLNVSNSDGNYTLKVTDGNGCVSNPVSYNLQKQNLISMYVLLGLKEVELARDNDVINGSVGVTSSHGEAEFDEYCSVASPGAFVKAHDIDVDNPVNIPTRIYSPAVVTLPTMLLNTSNPNSYSNLTVNSNTTVNGNYKDLTINNYKTVTVNGSIFRNIKIGKGSVVTFTATDISLYSLDMEDGSTMKFTNNTNLRVHDEVDIDKNCTVNPLAKKVTFYVKDPGTSSYNCYNNYYYWRNNNNGDESFVVEGQNTKVIANVYMPDGKLRTHGNGHSCNWNNNDSCTMIGLFIAEEIESDGKNIGWYSYNCTTPMMRMIASAPPMETLVEENIITVYPNPTNGQFTLQFTQLKDAADVRVTDIQGRLVAQKIIQPQTELSTTFDLTGKSSGMYLIEVRQGETLYRTRLILQ